MACLAAFRALGSSAFGIINIVNSIVDGKVKWSTRSKKKTGLGGGRGSSWSSRLSMPSWMSGSGSWMSSKVSKVAPSSIGSALGKS